MVFACFFPGKDRVGLDAGAPFVECGAPGGVEAGGAEHRGGTGTVSFKQQIERKCV